MIHRLFDMFSAAHVEEVDKAGFRTQHIKPTSCSLGEWDYKIPFYLKLGMRCAEHPEQLGTSTTDFVYLRFHGPGGNYRGSYADDVLSEYATYISEWLADGKDVYVYFNNTMGDAIGNLESLRSGI